MKVKAPFSVRFQESEKCGVFRGFLCAFRQTKFISLSGASFTPGGLKYGWDYVPVGRFYRSPDGTWRAN